MAGSSQQCSWTEGKLWVRDSNSGVWLDQSTQDMVKVGESPGNCIGWQITVTQIVNWRATIWQLVAAE
ncbi:hypothetical protein CT0861_02245 [Colletotrichum tofieldiae]|uniref:Uncharacterized protein n=1 Tax=Colletotrichum tofieldiae TaxID=708197 RepID=A0A166VN55_9PEZI|nr:hypothetical protein CT0861_02245 [Colletotrichum tofieldiae]